MKKIKSGKNNVVDLPERVDNVEGEEEIVEKFREVYNDLYNSADTSQAMFDIKQKLRDMIGPDAMREVDKTSTDIVQSGDQLKLFFVNIGFKPSIITMPSWG